MRTTRMNQLPKCDLCTREASYDSPTSLGGRWAYLCKEHYETFGIKGIGTKVAEIEKKQVKKPKRIETAAVPLTLDSIAEVECPYCGFGRTVEADANYTVECESCDNEYKVISWI